MRNNRTTSRRKITTYRLSPEINTGRNSIQPASAGTLGEKGCCWPKAQVLTLQIIRAIKRMDDRKEKVKGSWPWTHTQCTPLQYIFEDLSCLSFLNKYDVILCQLTNINIINKIVVIVLINSSVI